MTTREARRSRLALWVTTFISPVAALAASPMLARGLGPSARGELAYFIAVGGTVAALVQLGQVEQATAQTASAHARIRSVVRRGLATCAGAGALTAIAAGVGKSPWWSLLGGLVGLMMATSFLQAQAGVLGQFGALSAMRAGQPVTRLLALLGLYATGSLTVGRAALVHTLSVGVGVLLLQRGLRTTPEVDEPPTVATASTRVWATAFHLSNSVTLRLDQILLYLLASSAKLGVYAVYVGLAETLTIIGTALKPGMQREVAVSRDPVAGIRAGRRAALVVGGVALLGGAACEWPVRLLYGDQFSHSSDLWALRVLLLATAMSAACDLMYGSLVVLGYMADAARNSILVAAATAIALVVAIPFGLVATAAVSLGCYTLGAVCLQVRLTTLGFVPAPDQEELASRLR